MSLSATSKFHTNWSKLNPQTAIANGLLSNHLQISMRCARAPISSFSWFFLSLPSEVPVVISYSEYSGRILIGQIGKMLEFSISSIEKIYGIFSNYTLADFCETAKNTSPVAPAGLETDNQYRPSLY